MPARVSNRPVVILGMPVDGALLAGALACLGLDLGAEGELKAFAAFNLKCLAFFQLPVEGPRSLPPNWRAYPQGGLLVDELRSLLEMFFGVRSLWGLNLPLAGRLMPIYRAAFEEL